MNRYHPSFLAILVFSTFALWLLRMVWYLTYEVPYWYDPWFFRYAIEQTISTLPHLSFSQPPGYPYHEPLFLVLTTILSLLWVSSDMMIWPLFGILSILTAWGVYFFAKQYHSRELGIFAASIFLISIIQYEAYWWNYIRNVLGILFFLVTLAFLKKGSPLVIVTMIGMFWVHRPTAYFFLLLYILSIIADYIKTNKWNIRSLFYFFFALCLAIPFYKEDIASFGNIVSSITTTALGWGNSGTFMTSKDFFYSIFPYFVILIPAIFLKSEKKEYDLVFLWFILGLIYSVFRLYFYNRMFVFFDIFCIVMAAYAIVTVFSELDRRVKYVFISLFFMVQWWLYTFHVSETYWRHMISKEEFDIIENLTIIVPKESTILSTHRQYTPWLVWYSGMKVLAPGMLSPQIWDEKKWNRFYFESSDKEKCEMIQEYKSLAPKLSVFVGDSQPSLLLPTSCFRPLLSNMSHPIVYEVIY